jgi:HD-GYP domain-containing protein (c-di-GMP phosphodiesterase class II)
LTDAEYEVIKEHSDMGAKILGTSDSLHTLVSIVRHHHERHDGGGYPAGLGGHAIPLESRILAVADAVEAMASDRPYRVGLNASEILKEIQDNAGSQFDPSIVMAFTRIVAREGEEVIVNSVIEVRLRATGAEAREEGAATDPTSQPHVAGPPAGEPQVNETAPLRAAQGA